jgi:hypothetical protein
MFCLKLSEANIEIRKIGQVRYRKYDLPDHYCRPEFFFFISELKGFKKKSKKKSLSRLCEMGLL